MAAPSVRVNLDQNALDRLYRDPTSVYGEVFLTRTGNQIVNAAKVRANVDTGLMRSTIQFRISPTARPPVGEVVARTKYAKFVHDGTRFYRGNPFLLEAARDVIR